MSNLSRQNDQKLQIGLCLSGGGFRATFFHLGVVKLLRDAELLESIRDVCSVSGGSILAANLAVQWEKYLSPSEDESAFYQAVSPLIRLASNDLRGRIVRRWLLAGWALQSSKRTRLLESYYSKFLSQTELGALPNLSPRFHFLATSFTRGRAVSFTREGFNDGVKIHKASDIPLAFAVAASSAFPAFFPPAVISREKLGAKVEKFQLDHEYLTDGGVFDNLGIAKMSEIYSNWADDIPHVIIVSNASSPFDWVPSTTDAPNMIGRTIRTTDILMKRVGDLEAYKQSYNENNIVNLSIEEIVQESDLEGLSLADAERTVFFLQDQKVQKLVSQIRTDLDSFSLEEICSLVRHGYEVGLKCMLQKGCIAPDFKPKDPCLYPFPTITWPLDPEWIPYVNFLRRLLIIAALTKYGVERVSTIQNKMDAHRGRPASEELSDSDGEKDKEQVLRVRECLRMASARRLRLWNSADVICWLLIAILFGGLVGVLWRVIPYFFG
jgi:predicted acylesterase/phospholipase RssA